MKQETYDKLKNMLNEALEKETPESWNKYLDEQINNKAFDYLEANHSPSEVSECQAAMNIAVWKAYIAAYKQAMEDTYKAEKIKALATHINEEANKVYAAQKEQASWVREEDLHIVQSIMEASDNYVGHPKEVDEGITVSSKREAFKAGAKYAFEKTMDWFGNNAHRYMYIESHENSREFGYDIDKLIADFKKYVYNE